MTRHEKIMIVEIKKRFPEVKEDEVARWIYRRNKIFDDLSPADFNNKFGGKRWKKRLIKVVDLD